MVKVTVLPVLKIGRTVDHEKISVVVEDTNGTGEDWGRLARFVQSQRID
jgi:hypothetical protein